MRCLKCSTTNPDSAKYCLECGTVLPELVKPDFSPSDTSKSCLKCSTSNPIDGRYCLECGNPLEDISRPQPRLCPTCGISIDSSRLFCPNCSQSLIEKPLDVKEDQISKIETRTECPACGQLTTGDYCRSCGFNLITHQRKKLIDWWYCDNDSAIMAEIDSNSQILVSRSSLDESLIQAIDNNTLQPQDREKARSLSLQLFENGVTTKFTVITNVRCSVCGQRSLAPITKRPKEKIHVYPKRITLTIIALFRNGIFYFQTYPQLLIIVLCAIITNTILLWLGLSGNISYFPSDFILITMSSSPFLAMGLSILSILAGETLFSIVTVLMISLLVINFFQCWYNSSLKEIRFNKDNPPNIVESFKNSLTIFPRAVAAQLACLGIMLATIFGAYLVILLSGLIMVNTTIYGIILLLLFIILGILGSIALFTILFSFVNMSIIFDEKSGVVYNLKRSWRFGRRYFGVTLGLYILLYGTLYLFINFGFIPSIPLVIFNILIHLIEAFKSMSLGWAYDEYKMTVE
ncbi:MAG: zinc ribbon domain-containing protein [Candidatus Heimdallarchaeota archaeon]|nr:MAG: zinc ribbon domain-containing protein [Candidatus Heimdallarchaeota archaeon]